MKWILDLIPGFSWLKLALIGLAVAAVVGAVGWFIHYERDIGRKEVRAEWDADNARKVIELAEFNAEVRRMEQRRQSIATEAANAAQLQTQLARKDAAAARLAGDSLRDDLAAARAQLATAPSDAVRKYAATASAVLESCTRRYLEVAEAAQGHAVDSLMYQRAWPK